MTTTIRPLTIFDYDRLKIAMMESYSTIGSPYWRKERLLRLLQLFPEGQLCADIGGQVVGCALSIIVNSEQVYRPHTYEAVTDKYTFNTHDPAGDVLYGIEVFVDPAYRGIGLGRRLYNARKDCCKRLNLRSMVAGGRIPNYHLYADQMTPQEYVDQVTRNALYDPTLSFQLANGFRVERILPHYLKGDHESCEFATLLTWEAQSEDPVLPFTKTSLPL
ncbi:hypothetical protein GCM10023187_05400 [Nibrella viscosa]|uniref:N-acetyltransferase domain-containing protein n=1 Tax=Nibrella viscosa TaxID=1084524 RepID=A0ABP8JVT3_9BACT